MFLLQVYVVEAVGKDHDQNGEETVDDLHDGMKISLVCRRQAGTVGNQARCKT